jgi:hypothetical protein
VAKSPNSDHVFVNCPFDASYRPLFEAIVFAVHDLGFVPRCALEDDDGGEVRLAKIERIIEECRFGIHDLSAVALDPVHRLPRFNMPLELGIFLGCRRFGGPPQRQKKCLILDTERYRYQKFISDIAGQDIHAHAGEPKQAVMEVRNWLAAASTRTRLPGGSAIIGRYARFRRELPSLCADLHLSEHELIFSDLSELMITWLKASR